MKALKVGLISLIYVLLIAGNVQVLSLSKKVDRLTSELQDLKKYVSKGGGTRNTPPSRVDPLKQIEEDLKNPKTPLIEQERILGDNKSKDQIVVYTDMQCPFCKRGHETLKQLKDKNKNLKIVIKHLPLPMHPEAPMAAEYYELIALENLDKAFAWLDLVFLDQRNINQKSLEDNAKKVGVNMSKLKKNLSNKDVMEKIRSRIKEDMSEASNFGVRGTPAFNINGVMVRGAYPLNHLEDILKKTN